MPGGTFSRPAHMFESNSLEKTRNSARPSGLSSSAFPGPRAEKASEPRGEGERSFRLLYLKGRDDSRSVTRQTLPLRPS